MAIDGISGVLGSLLLREDTLYASGYSDFNWRRVQIGMTRQDVHDLLGQPLSQWALGNPGENGERWSLSPSDTNFRCRVLLFRDNRVRSKHSEFYFD